MLSIAEKLRSMDLEIPLDDAIDLSLEILLDDAIDSGKIPEHILHHFACDCAERALLREREAGRNPDSRSWEAIRVKRLWIEGEATDRELAATRSAARASTRIAARASTRIAAHASDWVAWDAACSAIWHVPEHIDNRSIWNAERAWQTAHLANLIEQYQQKRSNLLRLLMARAKQLETVIPRWQEESEDVLYS